MHNQLRIAKPSVLMLQATLHGRPHHNSRFVPNLKKRSNEELIFSAIALQSKGELTLNTLAERLCEADRLGDVDLFLPFDTIKFAVEWDGGYRHKDDRIEGDIRKTMKILKENPEIYIVRIRVGAPRIYQLEDVERCILVQVPWGTDPIDAMPHFANAIRPFLSDNDRLTIPPSPARAIVEVVNLRCVCDITFDKAFARVQGLLGKEAALKLINHTHGTRGNLSAIADGLERWKRECKMGPLQLRGSCAVASRLPSVGTRRMHLEEPFHPDTCKIDTCDQWCKIMCDGVASAISGDKADALEEPFHPKGHMQD